MKTRRMDARTAGRGGVRRPGPVTGIALWSARHPWIALALWLVVILATTTLGMSATPRMAGETDLLTGQSRQAAVMAEGAGYAPAAAEQVLLRRADGAALSAEADGDAVEALRGRLASADHVSAVAEAVPSQDGRAVLVSADIDGDADTASDRVGGAHDAVRAFQQERPAYQVESTGQATIAADFQEWLAADLDRATITTLPITLLILLVVFGAWIVAAVPLVIGAASVASAMGLWAVASQVFPDQGLVSHVILLIGMAVGVDYSLFYVRRFREERGLGRDRLAATEVAAATAGHSVLISGLAVCLSMAGLLLVQDTLSTGAAVGAILVVLIAMLSSLTALPAALVLLRGAINRPRVPFFWRLSRGDGSGRAVGAVVGPVMRHPWAALAAMAVLFGALAAPAASMSLKMTTTEDYPRSLASIRVLDDVKDAFPGSQSSARVVLQGASGAVESAAADVESGVAARDRLFDEAQRTWRSADGGTLVMDVAVPHKADSQDARAAVDALRDDVLPAVRGVTWAVGGDIAANADYTGNLAGKIPWVVGIVIALTFVFMLVTYRSLAVAAITVALNLASTLASFGALVLIFQGSWAQDLLGFTSTGHVVSWVPLMLFVILSGLSLDYHVLVVSRIQEAARGGADTVEAIRSGVARTAGVITSAAAIMIAVFCVFGGLGFIEMKQIGVGLAFAVLLDATVVRLVFLPALMTVCRRFLWWPGVRSRRTVHEERTVPVPAAVGQEPAPARDQTPVSV